MRLTRSQREQPGLRSARCGEKVPRARLLMTASGETFMKSSVGRLKCWMVQMKMGEDRVWCPYYTRQRQTITASVAEMTRLSSSTNETPTFPETARGPAGRPEGSKVTERRTTSSRRGPPVSIRRGLCTELDAIQLSETSSSLGEKKVFTELVKVRLGDDATSCSSSIIGFKS